MIGCLEEYRQRMEVDEERTEEPQQKTIVKVEWTMEGGRAKNRSIFGTIATAKRYAMSGDHGLHIMSQRPDLLLGTFSPIKQTTNLQRSPDARIRGFRGSRSAFFRHSGSLLHTVVTLTYTLLS